MCVMYIRCVINFLRYAAFLGTKPVLTCLVTWANVCWYKHTCTYVHGHEWSTLCDLNTILGFMWSHVRNLWVSFTWSILILDQGIYFWGGGGFEWLTMTLNVSGWYVRKCIPGVSTVWIFLVWVFCNEMRLLLVVVTDENQLLQPS